MVEAIWQAMGGSEGGLSSALESILNATLFKLFYYIETALCRVINVLMQLFGVFGGTDKVQYNGKSDYLINIFFSNKAVSNIYWAMALIGMALTFGFAIWAVVKKMFDSSGKVQQSHGQIITGAVRSLALIAGMTLIMTAVINTTNVLMNQISLIFNNAYHLDQPEERTFTDEEYSAMGRVLATIGNYSMVPTSNSRYNLNICFNDIREELAFLQDQGVFEYSYYQQDQDGNVVESWQSVLAQIAHSTDLSQDVKVDVYNQGVANSITAAMEYLRNNGSVVPVEKVSSNHSMDEDIHLDRMVFLMGTLRAAKNPTYNQKPAVDDALRGAYYRNENKSIYDFDQVDNDFNIGFPTDYLVVWVAAIAIIFDLVVLMLNCVARLFNMVFLYIIAPPVIAASPLDGGGKFRQWITAFLVQSLSVFGTVIAMRLVLIYLPIVLNPDLVLFENSLLNAIAKFVLVFGGFEAAKKATGLLTGILADSAGWQSIQAGDMSSAAGRAIGMASGLVRGAAGKALGFGAAVTGAVFRPVTNRITQPFKNFANKWSSLGTGGSQARAEKAVQDEVARGKARESYLQQHPDDAKYLSSSGGGSGNNDGKGGGGNAPPPLPKSQGNMPAQDADPGSRTMNRLRQQFDMNEAPAQRGGNTMGRNYDDSSAVGGRRPTLNGEARPGNRPAAVPPPRRRNSVNGNNGNVPNIGNNVNHRDNAENGNLPNNRRP